MANSQDVEADPPTSAGAPSSPVDGASFTARNRSGTANSSSTGRGRAGSLSMRFLESSPPVGMWHATGNALAAAPTPMEIRRGDYGHEGWDVPLQRRSSISSNEGRLSRVSSARSTAQTPASLARTNTFLGTHTEAEEEPLPAPAAGASTSKQPAAVNKGPVGAADDDDDPFSKFIGRGKLDSQSYTPRPKVEKSAVDPLDDVLDDDKDSLEDLDPRRPVKRNSALPKKFMDPTGDNVAMPEAGKHAITANRASSSSQISKDLPPTGPDENGVYPTGYKFPPKHTWGEATLIGLKAFWKFTITPVGFLIVIYGLNVVAWGGMLFLLLIGGGSQFMCYPVGAPPGYEDCNDINAPRRIWIEIDSQVLNALFCVTGFGLVPWRFRDLYYLMKFRIWHRYDALRRLAGIHRAWFRLPESDTVPADLPAVNIPGGEYERAIPLPPLKAPDPPLTGFRAPPTKMWKLDYVIWAFVINTFLQAVLSAFMWGYNRYARPSWSTGTFVALACIVAGLGGLMSFMEGKRVKAVEGMPVPEAEMLQQVATDVEKGKMEKQATREERQEERAEEKEEIKGKGRDDIVVR